MTPRLILASASPRRRELLDEAGYDFDVQPSGVDEDALSKGVDPHDLPLLLATAKAEDVAGRHQGRGVVILSADTVAYAGGQVLGKPTGRDDARRMLRLMAGSLHHVVTGYALVRCDDGRRRTGKVRSGVLMRPVSDDELERFLDPNQWQGKAGAYGIQDTPGGPADPFVEQITGELSNIVGLPMPQVVEALDELGVRRR